MSIEGKAIIVTGGTSGIGEGCTRLFAELGAKVVFASNQKENGEKLEAELKGKGYDATFAFVDVSDEESVKNMVQRALDLHGRIDGIHCNAGVWGKGKVTDFTEKDWDFIMGVNVKGVFWTLKHIIPVMQRQKKGVILITTSVAAFIGFPEHALYCASKAGLEALIRCLATDHADDGIRVVGLCPGTIDTPMLAASCEGWDKPVAELYAEVEKKIPVRRLGKPIDVAHAAAFLFSDEAGYINGTSLVLDGGTMALPPW